MDYQKVALSQGLPLLLIPAPSRDTVGLLLLIGVGSRHETADLQGLSRVFVNMCLKGTEKYPDSQALSAVLDKTGAVLQSEVHKEYTALYITAPLEHLRTSLDLLAELVIKPIFNLADLKKEKTYSLQDIKSYQVNPANLSYDEVFKLMFGQDPLTYSSLGTNESIEKIKRDDLISFQQKFYHAQNMLLCVCGQIQDSQELIEKAFSHLPQGQKPSLPTFNPSIIASQAKVIENPTPQVYFCLGLPGHPRQSQERRSQQILETILGRMRTNERLLKLTGPDKPFFSLVSQINLFREFSLFLIQGIATYENMRNGYDQLLKELDKTKESKISDWELLKAKGFYKGSLCLRLESLVERCFFYGLSEFLEGQTISLKQAYDEIDQITPEDLQKVALQIFNPGRYNAVFIGKRK